jgi:hypothetical protein
MVAAVADVSRDAPSLAEFAVRTRVSAGERVNGRGAWAVDRSAATSGVVRKSEASRPDRGRAAARADRMCCHEGGWRHRANRRFAVS